MWWGVWKKKSVGQGERPMISLAVPINEAAVGANVQPNEFDRKRIERGLALRKRYRYVRPSVRVVESGYLIVSPCCSRNVDPDGGLVDVALVTHAPGVAPWCLYRKEHSTHDWQLHSRHDRLTELLDQLNDDPRRSFWQ